MFENARIAFVGSGVMAEAMIKGILDKKLVQPGQIIAADPLSERGKELWNRYGVAETRDNRMAVKGAGIVVFSIKPQVLSKVLQELQGVIQKDQLIISIIAGARIKSIARRLNHGAIIRVMPNTPAQIGAGMSVWTATPAVTAQQKAQAQAILQALGEEIYVEEEHYLDMATAVSGTGPTYIFLMMEALVDAAVHLGFSRRIALQLVTQTTLGSVLFAKQSNKHLAELRNMVTSPGGTSAEAIYQMEKGSMRTVFSKAVWAAYQKSKLLGEMSEKADEEMQSEPPLEDKQ
jgi:pyrroline-5-carboxylate reductase